MLRYTTNLTETSVWHLLFSRFLPSVKHTNLNITKLLNVAYMGTAQDTEMRGKKHKTYGSHNSSL